MKKYLLQFLLIFTYGFGSSQNVTHHYINVGFIGAGTICAGDTVNLIASLSCVCGYPTWINTHHVFVGGCTWNCQIASVSNAIFQGPNIIQHSFPPSPIDCGSPGYEPVCKATPTQTSTYSVSWEKTEAVDAGSCGPYPYEAYTTIWHYSGQVEVVVDGVAVPSLSSNKTKVKPGEQFTLTVGNCEADGQTPDYLVYIKEKCGSIYSNYCWNNTFTFTAPSYSTQLKYKARIERTDPPWCSSEWTDEIVIDVEEVPNPTACNNQSIQDIEDRLATNPSGNDYHHYEVEDIICNESSNGPRACDISTIWAFMKSRADNQAPVLDDYPSAINALNAIPSPTLFLVRLGWNYFFPPNTAPISNCQVLNLPPAPERIGLGIGLATAQYFSQTTGCNNQTSVNIVAEPIKVVIDETSKCITNYTLPGHILYPGKVRRCLVQEDCNTFKIKTTGTGFHFCGDGSIGESMGILNKIIGPWTFNNVSERFIYNFNH